VLHTEAGGGGGVTGDTAAASIDVQAGDLNFTQRSIGVSHLVGEVGTSRLNLALFPLFFCSLMSFFLLISHKIY
jgi:hypothetical protein